ncbi:hypothetical protein EI94DRAFT_1715340 [Lactarius quietus]|nr:hypothetical protein EI94DRAFT_1715340 [Lactarius quietus]
MWQVGRQEGNMRRLFQVCTYLCLSRKESQPWIARAAELWSIAGTGDTAVHIYPRGLVESIPRTAFYSVQHLHRRPMLSTEARHCPYPYRLPSLLCQHRLRYLMVMVAMAQHSLSPLMTQR